MTRRPIRLAVFDMAGTTIDDRGEVYPVLSAAVRRGGVEVQDAQFDRFKGAEKRAAIAEMLTLAGAPPTPSLVDACFSWFLEELGRRYAEHPPAAYPGIEPMLAALRARGVRVGLTTGFSREIAEPMIRTLGWADDDTPGGRLIDVMVTGDQVPAGRPDPGMILRVMEQIDEDDPESVVAVGDTARDMEAAQRAGTFAVGVRTGGLSAETLTAEGADLVLTSAAELIGRRELFSAPSGA